MVMAKRMQYDRKRRALFKQWGRDNMAAILADNIF